MAGREEQPPWELRGPVASVVPSLSSDRQLEAYRIKDVLPKSRGIFDQVAWGARIC